MILKIKHFVVIVTIIGVVSCSADITKVNKAVSQTLQITDTLTTNSAVEGFVAPYRQRVTSVLDSALAYAPKTLTKEDGHYNTSEGNLLADLVLKMANPIFKARTGRSIDFVLLNHGGIRSLISEGKVSAKTAYEVMPFENDIVVVEMSGTAVRELVSFLIASKVPHPIAGIQIIVDKDAILEALNIQGKPFNESASYFVATSNYLISGGDNMTFFSKGLNQWELDYYIRNAMIDYFSAVDTLKSKVDDRFVKHN